MGSGNTQSCLQQRSWQRGKLNERGNTPWAVHVVITDAIQKAKLILEKIDERWPFGEDKN